MSEIRVENIIGETGVDAVKFTKGVNVTGIVTATSVSATNVSIGSSVTATSFFGSGAGLSGVSAGKILQVKTLSWIAGGVSGTGDTFHGVTSGNLQITPLAANSKFLLVLTGVNGHCNMGGSTGNHGCRYYFGMSIAGGSFVSVTTGNAFSTSDEEPLAATHINGDVGNWLDFPIDYSYVVTPSYSLGQAIDFRPYFSKNYTMGNALTYYFQHNTQASKGDHRSNFTIMEIEA
tara:strand:+ start:20 stop:718 length:699 start_codon:yes stop_codon:yes gene_type:complete